jgi:hypothetical protein
MIKKGEREILKIDVHMAVDEVVFACILIQEKSRRKVERKKEL